ncbi:MAG: helix-turn-helix domain-containing protein [Planctomycetaceae bacterium]
MYSTLKAIIEFAHSKNDVAWPSLERLAQSTGFSKRTVQRTIKALKQLNLVTSSSSRLVRSKEYRVNWSEVFDRAGIELQGKSSTSQSTATQLEIGQQAPPVLPDDSQPEVDMVSRRVDTVSPRVDMVAKQHGHGDHHIRRDIRRKDPPPPAPSVGEPVNPSGWEEVGELLSQYLNSWRVPLEAAQAAGLTPNQTLDLIHYYVEHHVTNRWGPGVLFRRLENAHASMQISQGWPPVETKARDVQQRAQREQQQVTSQQQKMKVRQQQMARQQQREKIYGPLLDAMPEAEVSQLAAEIGSDFLKHWRQNRNSNSVRQQLLLQLERRAEQDAPK